MRSKIHTPLLAFLIFLSGSRLEASKLEKGFEALSIYDYFLAKKLFLEQTKKQTDAYACYGLALIFNRNDNPFSNGDSAGKYIRLSYHKFQESKEVKTLSGFTIDEQTIQALTDSISRKMLQQVKRVNTVTAFNYFLRNFYLAPKKIIREAVYARDELEFDQVLHVNKSDTTYAFALTHPQSSFYTEALLLIDKQLYDENTREGTAESYIYFLNKYPKNILVNTAHEKLFGIYRQQKDINGLASFVKDYPKAPQNLEAWKLLFSLSVKEFSFDELKRFVGLYPDFPLKTSIL